MIPRVVLSRFPLPLLLLVCFVPSIHGETELLPPSITVIGTGEVSGAPDMAEVHAGVTSQAPTAEEALTANNRQMQAVRQALQARGIAEKDLQTANFRVTPRYRRSATREPAEEPHNTLIGYQVSNQLRVRVRDLATLGPLLDEIVRAGANEIQQVQFTFADSTTLMDEARRKAIADARRKANLYAEASNVRLGKVLYIQETSSRFPQPMLRSIGRMEATSAVPIAPGEQELQAQVTVTFAIP